LLPGTDEAALVLYQALRAGRLAARQVLQERGLDEKEIERALERLRELGLVQDEASGRPEPADPSSALLRTMDTIHRQVAERTEATIAMQERARALITVYASEVPNDTSFAEVESFSGIRAKERVLRELRASVRETCEAIRPDPAPRAQMLSRLLAMGADLTAGGVRCREIYPQSFLYSRGLSRYLGELSECGVEIRLIDHFKLRMIIVDRSTVCLTNPDDNGTVIRRSTHLLRTFGAIYEALWSRATPYRQASAAGTRGDAASSEELIVRLMASGLSDDQIAARTGIHRKTVQRAVSRLMNRVEATNRFQAGLKLAQSGMTAPSAKQPSGRRGGASQR
jgi:DNA-binding CsgD family transcriptional regulator